MARRRSNHGNRVPAGDLAEHAIGTIVPPDRMRLTRLQIAWPQVVRGPLVRAAWPGALRDGTLTLFVKDTQWQHELSYMKAELLTKMAERCDQVKALRIRVGALPEPEPVIPEPPPPVIVDLDVQPTPETIDALHRVDDVSLREVMANARMALSGSLRRD